ncbi:MAG: YjjG family noncanonical pyrimidine nucleotidase [Lachnospiraceae bacterium]|nr:YjjG family noncanonical pyrimidine nucleotidase [Lachnospiraceae bacterium]
MHHKHNIQILLWDIDGTILDFEKAEEAAIRKGFAVHGLGECTDEMLADYSVINRGYWQKLERGEMTKPRILVERFREFFGKYGLDTTKAEAFNADYQVNLGDTICFRDDALSVIQRIPKDIGQYVVTNGTAIAQHRKLSLSGLEEIMDGYYISDEVGFEKPGIEYFNAVFADLRKKYGEVDPGKVMIIGDSLTSDIRGGNNAGLICCWYNPKGLKNDKGLRIDYEIRSLQEVPELLGSWGRG